MVLEPYHSVKEVPQTSPSIKNADRKETYLARHKKNEDCTESGAKSAGFWSRHILWAKPTLKASIDDINKRFENLNVKMK